MSLQKNKHGFWIYDFWFGKKRWQGSTRLKNHEKAKVFLAALRTNLALKRVGIVEPHPLPTLSEFLKGPFTREVEQSSKCANTRYYYLKKIKILATYVPFQTASLDAITQPLIQGYKDWRRAQQKTVATINGDLRTMRKALRFAWKCKLIDHPSVSTLPGERNRIFVLSGEFEREYLALARYPLREVAILMLDLGLRPEEAVSLRKEAVTGDLVRIYTGKTANAIRCLPQTERTRAVFRLCNAVFPESEWVFPGRKGKHLTRGTVSNLHTALRDKPLTSAKPTADRVKVPMLRNGVTANANQFPREFCLYSLRHTFATRLAEIVNGDVFVLMKALGHSSPAMCAKYVHTTQDYLLLAFKRKESFDLMVRGEVTEISTNTATPIVEPK